MTLNDCVGHDPLHQLTSETEEDVVPADRLWFGLLGKVMLKGWIRCLVSKSEASLSRHGSLSSVKVGLKFLCAWYLC